VPHHLPATPPVQSSQSTSSQLGPPARRKASTTTRSRGQNSQEPPNHADPDDADARWHGGSEQIVLLIYCPFRALLHLPTWADRRRTFERVAASLQPDGRFAWNAFAFDHRIAARLDGEHQQEPVPHTNRYAVGDNRIDITLDSGARSSLWWATKNEWLGLLDVAGLELETLYGGFAGEPFNDDSREYVFIARRG
jgi:hypothetical protein